MASAPHDTLVATRGEPILLNDTRHRFEPPHWVAGLASSRIQRAALLLLAALWILAAPAAADEPPPGEVLFASRTLDAKLQGLEKWKDRWDAYQEAKEARAKEREVVAPGRDAWEKMQREGENALTPEEHQAAMTWRDFVDLQTRIAAALRRDNLSVAGWLMAFFAASLLWGGFAVTVTIAIRSEKQKREARGS